MSNFFHIFCYMPIFSIFWKHGDPPQELINRVSTLSINHNKTVKAPTQISHSPLIWFCNTFGAFVTLLQHRSAMIWRSRGKGSQRKSECSSLTTSCTSKQLPMTGHTVCTLYAAIVVPTEGRTRLTNCTRFTTESRSSATVASSTV